VIETGTPNTNTTIYTGSHFGEFNIPFQIAGFGPYVYVHESSTGIQVATIRVDICDDLNGAPSGAWVSRFVRLEARYSV